jgi:two-component system KDP operon response regulator KdpE
VTKPFDIEELLARLRAALRKDMPAGASEITLGRWTIDLVAFTATAADGEVAHLTPTEWRLLEILLRRPGQLVAARRLLNSVWGPGPMTLRAGMPARRPTVWEDDEQHG